MMEGLAVASILLVDDHPPNLMALEAALEPLGQRLVKARSGAEALRLLVNEEFAVILLDVQMPELDGLEASRQICQRWARGERPRIIGLTANAMEGDRELCLEAGMDDYVSKPIRLEELVGALSRSQPVV